MIVNILHCGNNYQKSCQQKKSKENNMFNKHLPLHALQNETSRRNLKQAEALIHPKYVELRQQHPRNEHNMPMLHNIYQINSHRPALPLTNRSNILKHFYPHHSSPPRPSSLSAPTEG
jgi:hypothetical protein